MFPEQEHPHALEGFEILRRLGTGGVGDVYLARSKAGRLVAIKVVGEGRRDEAAIDAFAREASLCVRLHHPCIVQVRAFLEEPGFAALVYEYVPGVALGRLLRFCSSHKVRLPDRVAWHIVERVVTALAYAHAVKDDRQQPAPIVHRDLSPSNVLVDWSGGVKISDFGIAKMLGVSPATRVGLVKGTLGCMAPEQARGEATTERADIFAAGLLAWRLATGRAPFEKQRDDEMELIRAMRNPRIKPLEALRPELPEPLLRVVAAALEPDAKARTLTAAEFAVVVRENIDVARGWLDLGELLSRWRGALERTVRPRELAEGPRERTTSLDAPATSTIRYEELALAFDEDPSFDAKTIEHHALPSDIGILASFALDDPMGEGRTTRESDGPLELGAVPIVPSYPPSFPAVQIVALSAPSDAPKSEGAATSSPARESKEPDTVRNATEPETVKNAPDLQELMEDLDRVTSRDLPEPSTLRELPEADLPGAEPRGSLSDESVAKLREPVRRAAWAALVVAALLGGGLIWWILR